MKKKQQKTIKRNFWLTLQALGLPIKKIQRIPHIRVSRIPVLLNAAGCS